MVAAREVVTGRLRWPPQLWLALGESQLLLAPLFLFGFGERVVLVDHVLLLGGVAAVDLVAPLDFALVLLDHLVVPPSLVLFPQLPVVVKRLLLLSVLDEVLTGVVLLLHFGLFYLGLDSDRLLDRLVWGWVRRQFQMAPGIYRVLLRCHLEGQLRRTLLHDVEQGLFGAWVVIRIRLLRDKLG